MDWVDLARRWVPRSFRHGIQSLISLHETKLRYSAKKNQIAHIEESDDNGSDQQVRFGIVKNSAQYHQHFVRACLEIRLPFRVIDLYDTDWLANVESARVDILLVWPDAVLSSWNSLIKDRVFLLEHELGYPCIPASHEIWMYEDKRRMYSWLASKKLPHPATWIFFNRQEALRFASTCDLPIVFKTNFGATSAGVRILRSRHSLRRLIKKCFRRGIAPGGTDCRDRDWGSVLLQEYLANAVEWRVVRIGERYMCRRKERIGDFHSGSGLVAWATPANRLLEFARQVTEIGGFNSMAVDVFETLDNQYLVNELQAVFGAKNIDEGSEHKMCWWFDSQQSEWRSEPGDFYQNVCANERIHYVLKSVVQRRRGNT